MTSKRGRGKVGGCVAEVPASHRRDAVLSPEAVTSPAQLLDKVGLEGKKGKFLRSTRGHLFWEVGPLDLSQLEGNACSPAVHLPALSVLRTAEAPLKSHRPHHKLSSLP